jgi:hypothetical protein
MISLRLKGKWSIRRRQGFHLTLSVSFTLCPPHKLTLISFLPKEEKIGPNRGRITKGSQVSSFLAINAKGGELIDPKQKDRTTKFSKTISQRGRNYFNCKNPLDI